LYKILGNENRNSYLARHRQDRIRADCSHYRKEAGVNNEAKERLRNIARKLVDVSFAVACDDTSTEEEFQKTVNALMNHLIKVRKRSQALHFESQMA
jgi:hypothetical protein